MKINNTNSDSQRKLKSISQSGSLATKTKMTVESDEKFAKLSNEQLTRPSSYMQKFASAIKKLNTF